MIGDFDLYFADFISFFPEFSRKKEYKFSTLSSGNRRIIKIYALSASKTKFCIFNEPFSKVTSIHFDIISSLIVKKQNKGKIITDHLCKTFCVYVDAVYFNYGDNVTFSVYFSGFHPGVQISGITSAYKWHDSHYLDYEVNYSLDAYINLGGTWVIYSSPHREKQDNVYVP